MKGWARLLLCWLLFWPLVIWQEADSDYQFEAYFSAAFGGAMALFGWMFQLVTVTAVVARLAFAWELGLVVAGIAATIFLLLSGVELHEYGVDSLKYAF